MGGGTVPIVLLGLVLDGEANVLSRPLELLGRHVVGGAGDVLVVHQQDLVPASQALNNKIYSFKRPTIS